MLVGCKRAERRGRTSSAQLGPKKKNVNSSKNGLAKIRFIPGEPVITRGYNEILCYA